MARGRFIKVDAVMKSLSLGEQRVLPRIKSGATLELAAKALANSEFDEAFVTDDSGRSLGLITLRHIAASLSAGSAKDISGVPGHTRDLCRVRRCSRVV